MPSRPWADVDVLLRALVHVRGPPAWPREPGATCARRRAVGQARGRGRDQRAEAWQAVRRPSPPRRARRNRPVRLSVGARCEGGTCRCRSGSSRRSSRLAGLSRSTGSAPARLFDHLAAARRPARRPRARPTPRVKAFEGGWIESSASASSPRCAAPRPLSSSSCARRWRSPSAAISALALGLDAGRLGYKHLEQFGADPAVGDDLVQCCAGTCPTRRRKSSRARRRKGSGQAPKSRR